MTCGSLFAFLPLEVWVCHSSASCKVEMLARWAGGILDLVNVWKVVILHMLNKAY